MYNPLFHAIMHELNDTGDTETVVYLVSQYIERLQGHDQAFDLRASFREAELHVNPDPTRY